MQPLELPVLFSFLKNPKLGSKGNVYADCPWCGKKAHFFINKGYNKKGVLHPFICFKCGEYGSCNKFLHKIGQEHLIEGERISQLKFPNIESAMNIEVDEISILEEPVDRKLPLGYKKINWEDRNRYAEYLRGRKFSEIDFANNRPGYTNLVAKLIDYVILPVTRNFGIKGYVGRYIVDKKDPEYDSEAKRYLNSKGTNFSKLLDGFDELTNKTEDVILVEGKFDKISVTAELGLHDMYEMKCCCTFGNKLSVDQIQMLRSIKSIKNLYLMYDGRDSVEVMKKFGLILEKHFNVKICYLPLNDPGASNAMELLKAMEESVSAYQFKYTKVQI